MAKWGEGDPRWIVEERADATNVNNWHWTEKNATNWSREKLKELLTGLKIENDQFKAKIKEITKCDGEASANNRKAKLIFFYEWVIIGDWEATLTNSENKTVYKGTFEIPNLSEENDPKEVDVSISLKDNKQDKLKDFMRSEGANKIRDQLAKYIFLLKEEYSQGLILPTKDSSGNLKSLANSADTKSNSLSSTNNSINKPTTNKTTDKNSINDNRIICKKLTMNEEFKCRANELYQVFVNVDMVKAFSHCSKLVYEPEKGGKFSLFDSNITGSFIELVKDKRIVMNWRNKRWPDEHYSHVTLEFNEKEDHTLLTLIQTGIPQNFIDNTEEGWRNFYWNSIRHTFGYGAQLM